MPLPLRKVIKLADEVKPKPEKIDIISKRRRSTNPLWVAITYGKPVSPVFSTSEEVLEYMKGGNYDIQKLHPQGDSELISKIREKYHV